MLPARMHLFRAYARFFFANEIFILACARFFFENPSFFFVGKRRFFSFSLLSPAYFHVFRHPPIGSSGGAFSIPQPGNLLGKVAWNGWPASPSITFCSSADRLG